MNKFILTILLLSSFNLYIKADDVPAPIPIPVDDKTLFKCPNTPYWETEKDRCPNVMQCRETICSQFTCKTYNEEVCPQKDCGNKVNCWDNSCVSNRSECPSMISCLNLEDVRCSDNSCVSNKDECPEFRECPNFIPFKCPNGDCRKSYEDCPQSFTCPKEYPVKCNDGSCKEKKIHCKKAIIMTTCVDKSMTRCSDGTCTPAKFLCPTLKTCPQDMVLCHNGLCAKQHSECFDQRKLSSGSGKGCPKEDDFMCAYSGACVDHIDNCPTATICPVDKPVKCWDSSCRETIKKCPEYISCPDGMIECPDGSCAKKICGTLITCPRDAPYKCMDNTCKKDPKDCVELKDCPPEKPYFCWNGSCVAKREDCITTDNCGSNSIVKCPDNMCRGSVDECKYIDYCPIGFNYVKYSNGIGICSVDESEVNNEICPQSTPVRCLDGLCMRSNSNCQSNYSSSIVGIKFRCADGEVKTNSSECKITSLCPLGKVKCKDNTCADSLSKCSENSTCPLDLPQRCDNGMCSRNELECLNISGCPKNYPNKCPSTGQCVKYLTDCTIDSLPNGCPAGRPFRCKEGYVGKCYLNIEECEIQYCNDPNEFFCSEYGFCASSRRECNNQLDLNNNGFDCPKNQIRCPDNICKDSIDNCNNKLGCSMKTPFRCLDGSCNRYPSILTKKGLLDTSCNIGIQCPTYKPYLCGDGLCVEKSHFCNTLQPCLGNKKRNFDRTCSSIDILRCPSKMPLLCSNGKCVNSIFDCLEKYCPPLKPIKCVDGSCSDNPQDCQIRAHPCDPDTEVMCYDGSCRPDSVGCPFYNGCVTPQNPFKCASGKCVADPKTCNDINLFSDNGLDELDKIKRLKLIKIGENISLCEDGIFRKHCPDFNGCPNEKPFLCSTGICVVSVAGCAGLSKCPLEKPFRCFNGSCESSLSNCNSLKKYEYEKQSTIFVHIGSDYSIDFLVSKSMEVIGKLYIPINTFYLDKFINTSIRVKVIAKSQIKKTKITYDQTRRDDIMTIFPYGDKEEKFELEYEYGVLSPAIEINFESMDHHNENDTSSRIVFKNNIIINLAYDFPETKRDTKSVLNPDKDICLGMLNIVENRFNCVGEFTTSNFNIRELTGSINISGIYAVILHPASDNTLIEFEENFIIKNFIIIISVTAALLLILGIGFYVFIRIYRYKEKYKTTKESSNLIQQKMMEMQNLGSSHLGQTIGDSIDNIIYTSNPLYKVEKVIEKSARAFEIDALISKYQKRKVQLENNNSTLEKKLEMLKEEIERMQEYKKLKEQEN